MNQVLWSAHFCYFVGVLFFCLIGCFSMIVWTPTVFECLICMRFSIFVFAPVQRN